MPTVLADPDRVHQVLRNLLSNALKFSPCQTTVTVSLHRSEEHHIVTVSDEGRGISAADRERLFEFFQRLSARPTAGESSTGLGLAICRKIALAAPNDEIEIWGDGKQTRSYCYIDDCVEGIELIGRPVYSVQYHPEAAPGPRDGQYLFERFVSDMLAHRKSQEGAA